MSELSMTGLVSGLDTRALVDKMMELERKPLIKLQFNQDLVYARKSMLMEINTKLSAVSNASKSLFDVLQEIWSLRTAEASDPTKLGATAGTNASNGTYQIDIQQLAKSQVVGGKTVLWSQALYQNDGVTLANSATALTSLKNSGGTSLGLVNGDKVSFSAYVGANRVEGSFVVGTDINTLGDLANAVLNEISTDIPGGWAGDVNIDAQGRMVVTGEPGASQAVSAFSLTATDSASSNQRTYFNQSFSLGGQTVASGLADYTFKIRVGTGSDISVNVAAGDTLSSVANKINSQVPQVRASVVDNRLLITSTATGTSNSMTLTDSASGILSSLGLVPLGQGTTPFAVSGSSQELQAAQDARVVVDGSVVVRSTNLISDAITGVTLNLKGTTQPGSPVQLTVASDTSSIKEKVKGLVEAYNTAFDFITSKISETPIRDPKTGDERLVGMFRNDSQLRRILREMREGFGKSVLGANSDMDNLEDAGITIDRKGKLKLDEAKLDAALKNDLEDVKALFTQRSTLNFSQPYLSQVLYVGNKVKATGSSLLKDLYSWGGSHLGLGDGSVISISAIVNGSEVSSTLILGATATVNDLITSIKDTLGNGINVTLDSFGKIRTTVPAGVNLSNVKITADSDYINQDIKAGAGFAVSTSLITALTDVNGNSLGVQSGDKIQISGVYNGSLKSGTLDITATTTLQELKTKLEAVFPGATFAIDSRGKLEVLLPAGNSLNDLTVSAHAGTGGESRDLFNKTMLPRDFNYTFEGYDVRESGFAVRLERTLGLIADSTPSAYPYSDLSQRMVNYQDQAERLQRSIDIWNLRLKSVETRLLKQFEEMEKALAQLQQQRNWLNQLSSFGISNNQSTQNTQSSSAIK